MIHFWPVLFLCFTSIGVLSLTEVQFSSKKLHTFQGLESRILNGHKAKKGQFPWQAALHIPLPNSKYDAQCGGSLIDKRWILTAAHCLNTTEPSIKISLGTTRYNIKHNRVDRSRIEFSSSKFHVHKDYNNRYPLINDIALIEIPRHVKFNENKNIQPIRLIDEELRPGTKVTVSGWGKTHEEFYTHPKYDFRFMLEDDKIFIKFPTPLIKFLNYTVSSLRTVAMDLLPGPKIAGDGWRRSLKAETSNNLLFAHLKIASNETCGDHPESVAGTICARGKRFESICEGDSGGPLVYYDEFTGTPLLVGVASESSKICTNGLPDGMYTSFYTDVYAFKEWIVDTMRNN